jgi:glycosyltransferase involved in cell wall biosynthesis
MAHATSGRKPKLLFLARPFPPCMAIGSVRTWNIARYLARLGWDVTVVTPHPSVWRHAENVEETDARIQQEGIHRILTGHGWRCLAPHALKCRNQGVSWVAGGICRWIARYLGIDNGVGWIKAAEQACATLTPNNVDVILATGSPFASFSLAKRLSDRLGRSYVLDYRDPWTGNPHRARPDLASVIKKEARLLADCAAVTIVSPSWATALEHRFGIGAKLHVITNGYDPEELADIKLHDFGHFAIVYAGNFYPPKRVISPVMAALKRLSETTNGKGEWYFHYYGGQEPHVREEAGRFGVMERTVLHGRVPREEALSAVRGAGVAVVITSVAEEAAREDKGIVPGKVFETVGLGSPILLIAPSDSDVASITANAKIGRSFTGGDTRGIASFLAEAWNGRVPSPREHSMYAWTELAKQMDTVLRSVMKMAEAQKC